MERGGRTSASQGQRVTLIMGSGSSSSPTASSSPKAAALSTASVASETICANPSPSFALDSFPATRGGRLEMIGGVAVARLGRADNLSLAPPPPMGLPVAEDTRLDNCLALRSRPLCEGGLLLGVGAPVVADRCLVLVVGARFISPR
jgi:hypothetical protein